MKNDITRRDALGAGRFRRSTRGNRHFGASADIKAADVAAPALPIEKGASLAHAAAGPLREGRRRCVPRQRPKFTDKTGVEVKVDFVGWEDINQQTAVTANTGAGPDLIIGFSDAPHIYVDKLIELTDVADYLGKRYGGWLSLARSYGKRQQEQCLDRLAFRRQRRSADLSQVDRSIGRLR